MADILIKGMETPKNCRECEMRFFTPTMTKAELTEYWNRRAE